MSKIFDIDYKRLIVLLLPTFLRKPILFALLKALVQPIIVLYDDFKKNRDENLYKATINSQVCYLRKMLNDKFDFDERRIYLTEGNASTWTFAYKQDLFNAIDIKQPLWAGFADDTITGIRKTLIFNTNNTGIKMISRQGAIGTSGLDFIVKVPLSMRGIIDENRLISQVNYYKLLSKRYAICYY